MERGRGEGTGRHGLRIDPRWRGGARCRCDWPDCTLDGDYPAPLHRERLREYRWLCLAHIREFNLRWDYFSGMSRVEIEAHVRADVTWHRPTWRMGGCVGRERAGFDDPFGFFEDDAPGRGPGGVRAEHPAAVQARMMALLGLELGFTLVELKRRFKALVKQHHPDLNGGDKAAEERLKSIIEAYTYLLVHRAYA
jgi:hypothetical protein